MRADLIGQESNQLRREKKICKKNTLCLYRENPPLPASTYIGILLVLQSAKLILWLHWFTEVCLSTQAVGFRSNLMKFNLS